MNHAVLLSLFFSLGFGTVLFAQSPSSSSVSTTPAAALPAAGSAQQEPPSTAKAQELLCARKYPQAAAEYQRIIEAGTSAPAGYAGLARVYLRQQKVDDAIQAARKAVELGPNLATSHVALGEVYFRQGKIEEAAEEFRRLILANTLDARAYYGLSRVMWISSYHHRAKLLLDRAHELDPKDPDILHAWTSYLPITDRIRALEAELQGETSDGEYRKSRLTQLTTLKEIDSRPARPCTLATPITSTETPLMPVMHDAKRASGYGLRVKFNGSTSTLMLDTGASGFNLAPHAAEKANIQKVVDRSFTGLGDQGEQKGYIGYAESIQVGELVFKDCYVGVFEKAVSSNEDGLMGADIFSQFLVELNLPDQKLSLSKLPEDPAQPKVPLGLETQSVPVSRFHDRYVAPEMKSFSPLYRSGHALLLPAKLNGQGPALMLIDTGASDNILNLENARQVSKISNPQNFRMKGVSGEVRDVLRAQDISMQLA